VQNSFNTDDVLFNFACRTYNPVLLKYELTSNRGRVKADQRRCRIQSVREHQTYQTCIHTRSDQSDDSQCSHNENNNGSHDLQPHRQPPVDGDTRKIADLVSVYIAAVRGLEHVLLSKGTNGGESCNRFREPGENGRPRDSIKSLKFPRCSKIVPV